MQTPLAKQDALMEYLKHTGSGAVRGAARASVRGEYVGQALFA